MAKGFLVGEYGSKSVAGCEGPKIRQGPRGSIYRRIVQYVWLGSSRDSSNQRVPPNYALFSLCSSSSVFRADCKGLAQESTVTAKGVKNTEDISVQRLEANCRQTANKSTGGQWVEKDAIYICLLSQTFRMWRGWIAEDQSRVRNEIPG